MKPKITIISPSVSRLELRIATDGLLNSLEETRAVIMQVSEAMAQLPDLAAANRATTRVQASVTMRRDQSN